MSIWSLDTITESADYALEKEIDELASQYTMDGTMEEADMMIYESAVEMYKCEAALYIADTFIERKALTEGAEAAEILTENIITEAAKKVTTAIKELWGKVTAWFKGVFESIQNALGIGKGFVVKYKDKLQKLDVERALKAKEIVAFPYSQDSLRRARARVNGAFKGADAMMASDMANKIDSVVANGEKYKTAEELESQIGLIASMDKNEFTNKLFAESHIESAKGLGDVKHLIVAEGRGRKQAKSRLTKVDMNFMIKFVETDYAATVKELKANQKQMNAKFKAAMDVFSGIEKRAENDDKIKGFFGSTMSRMKTNIFTVLTFTQTATSAAVAVEKEAYHSFIDVMRSLVSGEKKADKADKKEETTKESTLFESIMASL